MANETITLDAAEIGTVEIVTGSGRVEVRGAGDMRLNIVSGSAKLHDRFERHTEETMQPLWVRMGMHWGRQTRRRDDLIGHDVNLAARIADQAGPAELLLSEATVDRLAGTLERDRFEEIGPVLMKGIPAPIRLFRANGSGDP